MNLSKLKTNDYVLFLDGTVARVTGILRERHFNPYIHFDRKVKGQESESTAWSYTEEGIWGPKTGDGNDIIKILEDNNESEESE